MKKQTSFRAKLQHNIFRSIILLIVIAIIAFAGSLFIYSYSLNQRKADLFSESLTNLFSKTYHDYANYLFSANNTLDYQGILDGTKKEQDIIYNFYQTTAEYEIKADLILLDTDYQKVMTTLDSSAFNKHFLSFLGIVCDKVLPEEIASAVYNRGETYSRYLMCYPIMKDTQISGYLLILMDGSDWNYAITREQVDGVLTDRFGNIIACSQKSFIQNYNRFKLDETATRYTNNGREYIVKYHYLKAYDINVYTFSGLENQMEQLWIGVLIITLLGITLFIIAKRFANQIADSNTVAINQLIREIDIIKSDVHHHVKIEGEDEFILIAENINSMVDEINALHVKNAELADIRRQSEIKQLEAQFNPHFLYNTLDTIRYSILMDQRIASDLIIQMTALLRYSINNDLDQVHFSEDLRYTYMFLKIQKYRFNDRFAYEVNVDDACGEFVVPKLLLQPILENSIKYGFTHSKNLLITIMGNVDEAGMHLIVEDNGAGMSSDEVSALNERLKSDKNETTHYGLFNIARRLYLSYGEKSTLHVESEVGKYTRVTLNIQNKGDDQNV